GCIQDEFATHDSQGHKVNDPWPTLFPSGGFDLDAVGVIHNTSNANIIDKYLTNVMFYPNPVSEYLYISSPVRLKFNSIELIDIFGKSWYLGFRDNSIDKYQPLKINISSLPAGIYMIIMNFDNFSLTRKIFKK
ncbi:MAG: T9SS type A sorting domain-containing protein, partial [Bacteroidales bacterium]|nr:T9SS type A sorting domain-containing protein [Bacteroidales bacterium]